MDATAVVAIAGLIGTSGGAILAYRSSVVTSREETRRQDARHREEERRNRQNTYHQLIAVVYEVLWIDDENMDDLLDRWYFLTAGISLFASQEVVDKTRVLSDVLAEGDDESDDEWRDRTRSAAQEVVEAMREDIGIASARAGKGFGP